MNKIARLTFVFFLYVSLQWWHLVFFKVPAGDKFSDFRKIFKV